jgi:hypothetical protein
MSKADCKSALRFGCGSAALRFMRFIKRRF